MKSVGRWIAKTLGSAVAIVLVFVLLPYASRFMNMVMPDMSGAAITESATLARNIKSTARLETTTVDEQGVITSSTSAFLLGVVQSVAISYDYHASIGIDLSKVQLKTEGNNITFILPDAEVLSDSLTPDYENSVINDTWYTLTDTRRQELLDEEQGRRREACLTDSNSSAAAWDNTVAAFENYIASWVSAGNSRITFSYERAENSGQ